MSPAFLLLLALQQKPPEISVAGVAGWDRLAPLGTRTPVLVEIQNRGPDRDVRLALAWGPSSATRGDALGGLLGRDRPRTLLSVALPSGTRKRVWTVLEPVPYDGASAWVQVLDPRSGSTLATGELIPRVLPASKRLVAIVGRDRPAGLPFGDMEAAWLPPDRLPLDWRGYDPLDALVWLDAPVSDLASPAQLEALRLWIARGGRLVVARAETVGLAGTPMEDLLPVRLHSGREVELPIHPDFPRGKIPVLHTTVRRGQAVHSAEGTPLVVAAPQGAGTVLFAAFDPSRKPFVDFPRASALWSALLEIPDSRPDPSREDLNPDRSGLAALVPLAARIPDVAPPALEWLFLIIAVYVAVVGPLDFFLLRAFKRLEWTWFTFPVYVVAFTALILVAGGAFIVESAYHREVAIVDHYPDSDVTRRRAAAAVFATTPERYRIDDAFPFTSNFLTHEARGTPMPGPVGAIQVEDGRVRDWTLERGATGVVLADRLSLNPVPLAFTLAGPEGPRISLSVRNDSGRALRNAFLVTSPGTTYRLDDLPRGDSTVAGTRVGNLHGSLPMDPEERGGRSEAAMNNGLRRELMKAPSAWTSRGGSVLLAEPASAEPMVAFSPAPGRRSAYVLIRVFQRAP